MNLSFVFNSSDHIRYENGLHVSGPHGGAPRAVKVEPNISGGKGYTVTIYNTDEQYVIQMAPKQMEVIAKNPNQVILRGYGFDHFGSSFADYGLTINYINEQIESCTLHMFDRNIDIKYLSSEDNFNSSNNQENGMSSALLLNFDKAYNYLQEFIHLPRERKIEIMTKTDELNNIGVDYYKEDDLINSIKFYNKALDIFSLNDDALKNLIICYRELNDFEKMQKAQNLLDIVRRLGL